MIALNIKEDGERKFYYCDFGSKYHGKTSFRLWVHHSLVTWKDGQPYLQIPQQNVSLQQGKKAGTWILRPGNDNLFEIYVPCGYRGEAILETITPVTAKADYCVYHSPVGSLGVSEGCLITTSEEAVAYKWNRSGRLYGAPGSGTSRVDLTGNKVDYEETDVCEIEDLAEIIRKH